MEDPIDRSQFLGDPKHHEFFSPSPNKGGFFLFGKSGLGGNFIIWPDHGFVNLLITSK